VALSRLEGDEENEEKTQERGYTGEREREARGMMEA